MAACGLQQGPGAGVVAVVAQHGDQARARRGRQRQHAAGADVLGQCHAALVLVQAQQGVHQGVQRQFVARAQAVELVGEERLQQGHGARGLAPVVPAERGVAQGLGGQLAQRFGLKQGGVGVGERDGEHLVFVHRGHRVRELLAAVLVLAARAAIARGVALGRRQRARAPAVGRHGHVRPEPARHRQLRAAAPVLLGGVGARRGTLVRLLSHPGAELGQRRAVQQALDGFVKPGRRGDVGGGGRHAVAMVRRFSVQPG